MIIRSLRRPVTLPEGITCEITTRAVSLRKNEKTITIPLQSDCVSVTLQEKALVVRHLSDSKNTIAQASTVAVLLTNAIQGLITPYQKDLLLEGVGYRVESNGANELKVDANFSHKVLFKVPESVTYEILKPTHLRFFSHDKALLGNTAAAFRDLRRPDPYKGKGIRYGDETITLKETKK